MPRSSDEKLTYADAGVSIERGSTLVERIRPYAEQTRRPGVRSGLGGFGALFSLAGSGYRNPVLVATTDGVGTKLRLARTLARHDTIGIDLVAMCVNDLIVQGAEPLFFLDYYATGALDVDVAATVVRGIAQGCSRAGAALVGGETAEMPSMYGEGDYDLAGFAVGVVEEDEIVDGQRVRAGDAVLGIASSGPHSNGYSLIRRIVADAGADLAQPFAGTTLGLALLEPTRIYVRSVLDLMRTVPVHAAAHITGGGLVENPPRVLPPNLRCVIDLSTWQRPAVFDWLQQTGNVATLEMLRTFNCGIGMLVVIDASAADAALKQLAGAGERAFRVGHIEAHTGAPEVVFAGLG